MAARYNSPLPSDRLLCDDVDRSDVTHREHLPPFGDFGLERCHIVGLDLLRLLTPQESAFDDTDATWLHLHMCRRHLPPGRGLGEELRTQLGYLGAFNGSGLLLGGTDQSDKHAYSLGDEESAEAGGAFQVISEVTEAR